MTIYCANCGRKAPDDAKFCGVCGARIEECANLSIVNKQYSGYDKHDEHQLNQDFIKKIKELFRKIRMILNIFLERNLQKSNEMMKHGNVSRVGSNIINCISQNLSSKSIYNHFLKREGRLNRFAYFKLACLIYLCSFALGYAGGYISRINEWKTFLVVYTVILTSIFIVPTYCVMVRRLHDLNRDQTLAIIVNSMTLIVTFHYIFTSLGSYSFLGITALPLLLWVCWYFECVIELYLIFAKGTSGDNQYGEDPLKKRY